MPPKIRSAGVTAAATLAVLGSVAVVLAWGPFFLQLLNLPADASGKHVYQTHTVVFLLVTLVPPLLAVLSLGTGIGLFRLRAWARRAALLWASLAAVFSLAVIALRPYETFAIPEHFVSESESFRQIMAVSLVILALPVSLWWLFFFRLKGVVRQFEDQNGPPPSPLT